MEASPTYVGVASCRECHAAEYERWRGSHHDLAMQPAKASTVLGDFGNATANEGKVTTTFLRRGDKHIVQTDGPDGVLADFEVAYTFGVHPLQQYLVAFEGGRLQPLPWCWDARPKAEGGQRWYHLYPGQRVTHTDPLHWTGRVQNWNHTCAECHSTQLQKRYDAKADRYDTKWEELNVACEACHGPGSRHVAWARQDPARQGPDDGLVLHLKTSEAEAWFFATGEQTAQRRMPLQSNAQVETCARCHSRRTALIEDYRHGQPLADSHELALLDEGLYRADGQIQDEVYVYGSFVQSRMYHKGVACADCHEPHGLALRAEGNALCVRCHDANRYDTGQHHFHAPATPGAQCVDCHMPERVYMGVDRRRDHALQVPRPDLSVKLGTPNACTGCHADKDAAWAAGEVRTRFGAERLRGPEFAHALNAGRSFGKGAPDMLRALVQNADRPAIARATALRLLASWADAKTERVARRAVEDADPLVRAAAVGLVVPDAAVPLLSDPIRSVRIAAVRALAGRAALPAKALEEYLDAQKIAADQAQAHVNLGVFFAQQGDVARAQDAYEEALRLQPDFVVARANLADLHRAQGREAECGRLLREGLARNPRAAALHHALGLYLVRIGERKPALSSFTEAVRLDPSDPSFLYVHAVAVESVVGKAAAAPLMKQLQQRFPSYVR